METPQDAPQAPLRGPDFTSRNAPSTGAPATNITVAVVPALASIAAHATAAATRHRVASTDGHGLRRVQDTGFPDVSCSGAAIADLTRPQPTGHGTNPPRPAAFSPKTRLVTLGIGGNDIGFGFGFGFGSMIRRCVTAGVAYQALRSGKYIPEDAPCKRHYVDRGTDEVERKIEAAGERLACALTEINRRAPQVRASSAVRQSCPPTAPAAAAACPSPPAT
ncbi:hypothetical protein AB5J52_44700 [Streptomyces sp. R39]|uniref:SGNH hydrolase-type esterase domain-containing protein n=1 Tax=Streptomyces sp. R39 TaxID=3238631 RepID=A0AB39R382_9ACTN